jgi:hypothetical protein
LDDKTAVKASTFDGHTLNQWLEIPSNIALTKLELGIEKLKPAAVGIRIQLPLSDTTFSCLKKRFASWKHELPIVPQLQPDTYVAEDFERLECLHRATSLQLCYRLDTMTQSNWSAKGTVRFQFLKEFNRLERLTLRAPKNQRLIFPPDFPVWQSLRKLILLDIEEEALAVTQLCPHLEKLNLTRLHHGSLGALGKNLCLSELDIGGCMNLDFTGLKNIEARKVHLTEIVGHPKNLKAIGESKGIEALRLIRIAAMTTLPDFIQGTLQWLSLVEMRNLASVASLRGGALKEFHLLSCPKLNAESLKVLATLSSLTTVTCGPRRAKILRPLLSPSVNLS